MIRSSRRAAMLAVLASAAFTWSCVADTTSVSGVPRSVEHATPKLLGNQLLACTPIDSVSVTQAIGPSGGTLNVGPHQLIVLPNALDSTVNITAIAPSDTVNRVLFYPEGLTFNTPVVLKMSYANCGSLSWLIPKYVVYLDGLSIANVLGSLDDIFEAKVSTSLEHFSGYAVAW
jgi:hypothetical protein